MRTTPFAGLTLLEPGEPLSTDGFSFQDINPDIIDRLLRVGAVSHRHDAHAALADPTAVLTSALVTTAGSFPADLTANFIYTLVDAWGGETLPGPVLEVLTPPKLPAPNPPTAVADYTAGSMLAGTYLYVLTYTDGAGGETTPSGVTTVVLAAGHANAQVQFSALMTGAPSGAAGWRLYKSQRGSNFLFVAEGTSNTLTDDGTLCADCTGRAPSSNTTLDHNTVQVTVPATFPTGTVAFRLYGSIGAGFASPSFFGQYDISNAGATFAFASFNPTDGRPPVVSTAIPGAEQIDESELTNSFWRPPVDTATDLPASNNKFGDVRVTLDDFMLHVWNTVPTPDAWQALAIGGSPRWASPVANAAALPGSGNTDGDVRMTLDDHTLHAWNGSAWIALGGSGGGSPEAWHAIPFNSSFPHWRSITDSTSYAAWRGSIGPAAPPPAGYYKDPNGVVWLRGGVEVYGIGSTSTIAFGGVGSGNPSFTLPSGYHPDSWRRFAVDYILHLDPLGGSDLNMPWRVFLEIYTDGTGTITTPASPVEQNYDGSEQAGPNVFRLGDQFSLEGIAFRAA